MKHAAIAIRRIFGLPNENKSVRYNRSLKSCTGNTKLTLPKVVQPTVTPVNRFYGMKRNIFPQKSLSSTRFLKVKILLDENTLENHVAKHRLQKCIPTADV
jgi:hypothetical protein